MADQAKDLYWKILTGALTAAVLGAFGWIVKVESELVAMGARLDRVDDEVGDLEREVDKEVDEVTKTADANRIDVVKMNTTLDSIKEKVNEIRAIVASR